MSPTLIMHTIPCTPGGVPLVLAALVMQQLGCQRRTSCCHCGVSCEQMEQWRRQQALGKSIELVQYAHNPTGSAHQGASLCRVAHQSGVADMSEGHLRGVMLSLWGVLW
jgi:hypothetical protein